MNYFSNTPDPLHALQFDPKSPANEDPGNKVNYFREDFEYEVKEHTEEAQIICAGRYRIEIQYRLNENEDAVDLEVLGIFKKYTETSEAEMLFLGHESEAAVKELFCEKAREFLSEAYRDDRTN